MSLLTQIGRQYFQHCYHGLKNIILIIKLIFSYLIKLFLCSHLLVHDMSSGCRNLLLPAGMPLERQRASYSVVIYQAEDLPTSDLGVVASMRQAVGLSPGALVDAYVRVSFVGLVVSYTDGRSEKSSIYIFLLPMT